MLTQCQCTTPLYILFAVRLPLSVRFALFPILLPITLPSHDLDSCHLKGSDQSENFLYCARPKEAVEKRYIATNHSLPNQENLERRLMVVIALSTESAALVPFLADHRRGNQDFHFSVNPLVMAQSNGIFCVSPFLSVPASIQSRHFLSTELLRALAPFEQGAPAPVDERMEDGGAVLDLSVISEEDFDKQTVFQVNDKSSEEIAALIRLNPALCRAEASLPRNLVLKPSQEKHTDVSAHTHPFFSPKAPWLEQELSVNG